MPPKVFISHASEDKDRFVVKFAERLIARGVDAWLDAREMLPGDSLVDKIHEEGLKNADVVLVVVSEASVAKPWVREELNAGVVHRVNRGIKVIPVVIDECEVPAALISTLYQHIKDTASYDAEFERIVAAIFGLTDKSPIGPGPAYGAPAFPVIGTLSKVDSMLLALACEAALDTGNMFVSTAPIFEKAQLAGAPLAELEESLEILGQDGYFRLNKHISSTVATQFWVTDAGFEIFARERIPDYRGTAKRVVSALVNDNLETDAAIAAAIGEKQLLVKHILGVLEQRGVLTLSGSIGPTTTVAMKKPGLSRLLSNG